MVRAVLYLVPSPRLRSSRRPKISALLILTLFYRNCQWSAPVSGIALSLHYIPVQESQQIENTKNGEDMEVDLREQLPFGGSRELGFELTLLGRGRGLRFFFYRQRLSVNREYMEGKKRGNQIHTPDFFITKIATVIPSRGVSLS
jgi:hypothetical protein